MSREEGLFTWVSQKIEKREETTKGQVLKATGAPLVLGSFSILLLRTQFHAGGDKT